MLSAITNFLQSTKMHILGILLSSAYITILLLITYNKHIYREHISTLESPSVLAKELANDVEVGFHVNSFPYFSFKHTTFTVDGILWFKFDQGAESIETLESFSIKNMIVKNDGKTIYKSKPIVKIIDEKVLVSYHIQATFMTEIIFKKFPIGDHRINMLIENRDATANELLFYSNPKNITFNQHLLVDDWNPCNVHTNTGIVRAKVGSDNTASIITYPGINIAIDFENIGIRSLISLYFPLFVLFFIGLLSLSIGIFDPARLGIIASSLPTLVLFRLVIDAVSPEIGYATHIDFVYYLLVALSIPILFFQVYVILFIEKIKQYTEEAKERMKSRLESLNGLLFMGVLIALLVIMTYDFFH